MNHIRSRYRQISAPEMPGKKRLDELTLMIHPVAVGSGKRLFKEGRDPKRLKLIDSTMTSMGVAILTYRPM
jgi:dihydrofolate reductase